MWHTQLVSNLVAHTYEYDPLLQAIKDLIKQDWHITVRRVYREANHATDFLANYALSTPLGFRIFHNPPLSLASITTHDMYIITYHRLILFYLFLEPLYIYKKKNLMWHNKTQYNNNFFFFKKNNVISFWKENPKKFKKRQVKNNESVTYIDRWLWTCKYVSKWLMRWTGYCSQTAQWMVNCKLRMFGENIVLK